MITPANPLSRHAPLALPPDATGRARLAAVRHVALDMDGTIYCGKTLFPFTASFLDSLKEHGVGYSFLTNNSSRSAADYARHLAALGLRVTPEEIHTSGQAALEYLRRERPELRRLLLLGTESLAEELRSAGYVLVTGEPGEEPDAVLAGFDLELGFAKLGRAAYWIARGKPYFATHPDRVCPTDEPTVLIDCGAMCAMLREATGRSPDLIFGKPEPRMLLGLARRLGLEPAQVAMVGDRLYTDVEMARRAEAVSVLVLSGEATLAEARASDPPPDFVVENVETFGRLLQEARQSEGTA